MRSYRSRSPAALALCAALLALQAVPATHAAPPDAPAVGDALPVLRLKLAPELVPPQSRPPPRAPAGRSPGQVPAAPLKLAPFGADGGPIFVRADTFSGVAESFVEASGKVELRGRNETVLADWLRYDFELDEIWGKGNVLLRRGFDWITGPEARFRRDAQTGTFTSPRFFVAENGGRGDAAEIRMVGPDRYEVKEARYTTCVAPREDWYIKMEELEVDKLRKVGTAYHATVRFFGVPIAYSPWLEFPLSNERKSGFLTPTFGSSSARGFDAAVPYYLNLAPNYDATLTPRVMTKRGFQLGAQFRYLLKEGQGEMEAEDLPEDRVTGTNRYALTWKHNQSLGSILPGLAGYINLNKVSDDTYFSDLSDRVSFTSLTTLVREGGITYANGPWQLRASAQAFQTLQDPTAPPVTPPYNRVPQLLGVLQETDWKGLTFAGVGEFADFQQPTLTTGQRAYVWPTVAWSRQGAAWSFTARTGAHLRQYNLHEVRPGVSSSQSYAIPITSVDAGLVFEREWGVGGRNVVQTLEPRAFYVYSPYKNQNDAPVFDSALDDFNFGQLFSPNRYLGNDRIGDANQLTLALSSRFIDAETGIERLRVAVGERFYFQDQRVVLNESPRAASTSDVLVGFEGRLSDAWSLIGLWQYNFDASQTERLNAGVRHTPAPGRALNATYTYSRQNFDPIGTQSQLNQFDLSAQWPISANWTVLGRWNYSVLGSKTLEAVAGVEYNAGCWAFRLVGQRLTTTTETTSNSIYLQLELNGLARIGTSPLDLLRRSVPGYQQTNNPALSPRERGDFFPDY